MEHFENAPLDNRLSSRNSIHVTDALIQSVTTDRGTAFVTIEYNDCAACQKQTQVTLIVTQNTRILDERGRSIRSGDLEPGMRIDATFSENMTRSIPVQTQAFQIRIRSRQPVFATTIGRILEVNTREQFIRTISDANPTSIIRFNILPETRILDPIGRRISLSNLFPGLRVRVEHATFMTASLPPQSPAYTIRIIR